MPLRVCVRKDLSTSAISLSTNMTDDKNKTHPADLIFFISITAFSAISAILLGHFFWPVTKEYNCEDHMETRGDMMRCANEHNASLATTTFKEISILKEKADCEKAGGRFTVIGTTTIYLDSHGREDLQIGSITCTQHTPDKEIFSYKIQ